MASAQYSVTVNGAGTVELTVDRSGARSGGSPVLLLHGAGDPEVLKGLGEHLAAHHPVFLVTHPGFGGTERPQWLDGIQALARLYLALLAQQDLRDVTVVGHSFGGWVGAEMALTDSSRLARLVIVSAVGPVVPAAPRVDITGMTADEVRALSFHDPQRFGGRATESDASHLAGNMRTTFAYCGPTLEDPTLLERLGDVQVPVLVVWGASDRLTPVGFGRAFAAAMPTAEFVVIPEAGHVPQVEAPAAVMRAIDRFIAADPAQWT
jgi:pimeloyl-ACP methyl ester carboxylesterase